MTRGRRRRRSRVGARRACGLPPSTAARRDPQSSGSGPAARESVLDGVPVPDLVLAELPAEQHGLAAAERREVDEPLVEILDLDAELDDVVDARGPARARAARPRPRLSASSAGGMPPPLPRMRPSSSSCRSSASTCARRCSTIRSTSGRTSAKRGVRLLGGEVAHACNPMRRCNSRQSRSMRTGRSSTLARPGAGAARRARGARRRATPTPVRERFEREVAFYRRARTKGATRRRSLCCAATARASSSRRPAPSSTPTIRGRVRRRRSTFAELPGARAACRALARAGLAARRRLELGHRAARAAARAARLARRRDRHIRRGRRAEARTARCSSSRSRSSASAGAAVHVGDAPPTKRARAPPACASSPPRSPTPRGESSREPHAPHLLDRTHRRDLRAQYIARFSGSATTNTRDEVYSYSAFADGLVFYGLIFGIVFAIAYDRADLFALRRPGRHARAAARARRARRDLSLGARRRRAADSQTPARSRDSRRRTGSRRTPARSPRMSSCSPSSRRSSRS